MLLQVEPTPCQRRPKLSYEIRQSFCSGRRLHRRRSLSFVRRCEEKLVGVLYLFAKDARDIGGRRPQRVGLFGELLRDFFHNLCRQSFQWFQIVDELRDC